jgi:feruloyl esterase
MRSPSTFLVSLLPIFASAPGLAAAFAPSQGANCTPEYFKSILPPNATVRIAQPVANGTTFTIPSGNVVYPTSPAHMKAACAVEINVTSSASSAFSFGLFLPTVWNERFLTVGNGGFAGGINWLDMSTGLGYGFVTMSTDAGHNSTFFDMSWALNNEERKKDWGYRAMHNSIVMSKRIIEQYYSKPAKYSYYNGCSAGGRQGLRELQLHPESFDGVLAGAPAWQITRLSIWQLKVGLFNLPVTAPHHIPPALFDAIAAETLRQCDAQDGLVDNVISDSVSCEFRPETLLCASNVTNQTEAGCLTSAQLDTYYQITSDYKEANNTLVYQGMQVGAEDQWRNLMGSNVPSPLGPDFIRYMILNDSTWDYWKLNGTITELADKIKPGNSSAEEYDLEPFHKRGGKLLHWHGDSDGLEPTANSLFFYNSVLRTLRPRGIELDSWYRFFIVPGLQHCLLTPARQNAPWYFAGANQALGIGSTPNEVYGVPGFRDARHDVLLALMNWVERGKAPDSIIATKWKNETNIGLGGKDQVMRQRPICPYPKQAKYIGRGDPNLPGNWKCRLP